MLKKINIIKVDIIKLFLSLFVYVFLIGPLSSSIAKLIFTNDNAFTKDVFLYKIISLIFTISIITFYKVIILIKVKKGNLLTWTFILFAILIIVFVFIKTLFRIEKIDSSDTIWGNILLALLNSSAEDLFFLGFVLHVVKQIEIKLKKYSYTRSLFMSGIIFSMSHLINLRHQPFLGTILQMEIVFGLFMLLGLLYIGSNSIIFPILFHSCWDFPGISSGIQTSSQNVLIPQLIVGFIIALLLSSYGWVGISFLGSHEKISD